MIIQKANYLMCVGLMLFLLQPYKAFSQENDTIQWASFEQLTDLLLQNPKPVFVYFYADWCSYCHEMDRTTFRNAEVASLLNTNYYAVKMNVEIADTIQFGSQIFINDRIDKRNSVHQIAQLMASRKDAPFTLPAMILLDQNFEAKARYFQYLGPKQLSSILKAH